MPRPWTWDVNWKHAGLTSYNLTEGTPQWQDYVETVGAYYYNSMQAPTVVSFVILGVFGVCVLLVAATKALKLRSIAQQRLVRCLRSHVTDAPLLSHCHAEAVPLLGRFITMQLPLRLESLLILALFMVNLLPLVSFYRPSARKNLYWPVKYDEILRYVADRSGVIATLELPPIFILSGRNNLVIWATGASYEKCLLFHRWFARFVFVQVVVHAIAFSLVFASHGAGLAGFRLMFQPYVVWGTAGTVALGFSVFLSLRYLRQYSYEIFVAIHIVMAIIALVGTYYHIQLLHQSNYDDFINALYFCVAVYCLDKVARAIRVTLYSVERDNGKLTMSSDTVTMIAQDCRNTILRHEISLRGLGKRTTSAIEGAYVQLCIPRLQLLSSHPFTVAQIVSNEQTGERCAYLYTKVHKGITKKLLKRIEASDDKSTQHYAFVEGFYGCLPPIDAYEEIVLLTGSVGITVGISLLMHAKRLGKQVKLHWVIPGPDILQRTPTIESQNDTMEVDSQIRIIIHITLNGVRRPLDERTSGNESTCVLKGVRYSSVVGLEDDDAQEEEGKASTSVQAELQALARLRNIHLTFSSDAGRPNVAEMVTYESSCSVNVAVISCGPDGFCDDARLAARQRNIAYYEEAFRW